MTVGTHRRTRLATLGLVAGALAAMAGCNNALEGGITGAGLGAVAGTIIGSTTGNAGEGAAIGAALGGVGGAVVGDQNRRADERARYGGYHRGSGYPR